MNRQSGLEVLLPSLEDTSMLRKEKPKWVNIPYDECPCWALVTRYMREELGVSSFPTFSEFALDAPSEEVFHAAVKQKEKFVLVQNPRIGDLVLYKYGGEWHAGVVIPPGDRFLHTERKTGSLMTRLNHPIYKKLRRGFYRWKP
jgi:hypothetical protein